MEFEQFTLFDYTMPMVNIDKPIRLIELFAGIGSTAMALRDIGADFEHYRVVEFDKYAIASYNAIHGTNFPTMDITQTSANDLCITDTDKYCYVMTYSFPCGLPGTLIKTTEGYKKIEEVKIGDCVLTHKNRYEKVIKTMQRESPDYYEVKVLGYPKLRITAEHPMYVLRDGDVEWVKVKDIKLSDKVCFNINTKSIPTKCDDKVLWLLGRYVADGHINKYTYNSVNFSIAFQKEEEFIQHVPDDMLNRFSKFRKSCLDYRIADEDFQDLCMECGNGATNKKVPQWVQDLPAEQAKCFLDGYLSGDGHIRQHGNQKQMMFSTVSKELFLGIQNLIMKIYGIVCSCSLRTDERKESFNDTYNGQFPLSGKVLWQEKLGTQIFTPIRELKHINNPTPVFNFEVKNDNSYTMENIVVHNCQDLSVAGKQAGMKKGSGTRSGLLWEVERILCECEELPQVLLMENVPMVHSADNMPDFQKWIDFLTSKGYSSYWQDLNAKNYGVAQNRERCFMVSILGEWNYKFPQPIPLEKVMKDYLEENVPDKYYITSEKAKKLIDSLILDGKILTERNGTERNGQQLTSQSTIREQSTHQTASRQDMTMESQTCSQMETVLLNGLSYNGNETQKDLVPVDLCSQHAETINIANAIAARYDAGICKHKYEHPGVVEWKKL